jgi:hypothetical protein
MDQFKYIYTFLSENYIKIILFISVFLILFYIEKLNYRNSIMYGVVPVLPIASNNLKQAVKKISSRNKKKSN